MEHQVPTDPATCTPSKRKGRKGGANVLEEFWHTVDLGDPELEDRLAEWQHFYNWDRPHDSLGGRPPIARACNLLREAPTGAEIAANYDPTREFILPRNDLPARLVPRCVLRR